MNVEIGAEATPFPEKEYISGIFVAVWWTCEKGLTAHPCRRNLMVEVVQLWDRPTHTSRY